MADLTGSPTYKNTIRGLETSDPIQPETFNPPYQDLLNNTKYLKDQADAHLADSMYQPAGGTATAITLTISEALANGFSITFIASANNNAAATTINGKPLYKPNTTIAPNLIAGKAYTVWYNSTSNCFFIKASAEGTAVAANVLAGTTFSNDDDSGLVGTMPDRSGANQVALATIVGGTTLYLTPPKGYYDGVWNVQATDANWTEANIKQDVSIFGKVGTLEPKLDISFAQNLPEGGYYIIALDRDGTSAWAKDTVAFSNHAYRINSGGTIVQDIIGPSSFVPLDVSDNYILWSNSYEKRITNRSGTILYSYAANNGEYYTNLICEDVGRWIGCLDTNFNRYSLTGTFYGQTSLSGGGYLVIPIKTPTNLIFIYSSSAAGFSLKIFDALGNTLLKTLPNSGFGTVVSAFVNRAFKK